MKCEIIAVGTELLTPFRQDTNSLYLTEKLNEIGVAVHFKTIAGDRHRDLVNAVRTALARVDLVCIMGGLGPTEHFFPPNAVAHHEQDVSCFELFGGGQRIERAKRHAKDEKDQE